MTTINIIAAIAIGLVIILEYVYNQWLSLMLKRAIEKKEAVEKYNKALVTFALMSIVKIGEETEDYKMAQRAMDYLESEGLLDEAKSILNESKD